MAIVKRACGAIVESYSASIRGRRRKKIAWEKTKHSFTRNPSLICGLSAVCSNN